MAMDMNDENLVAAVADGIKASYAPDHADTDFNQAAKTFIASLNACQTYTPPPASADAPADAEAASASATSEPAAEADPTPPEPEHRSGRRRGY